MSSASELLLPGQPLPETNQGAASSVAGSSLNPQTGTYQRGEYVLSSLIGQANLAKKSKVNKKSVDGSKDKLNASVRSSLASLSRLPEPDSVILGRVTRITSRQAVCSILLVLPPTTSNTKEEQERANILSLSQSLGSGAANHAAGEDPSGLDFSGIIRQQDVRLTETDKVKIADCFRVGDLVKAKVVSLGDSRSYFLTTASNELGVIFATASPSSDVLSASAGTDSFLPTALASSKPAAQTGATTSLASLPSALRPVDWQTMLDPVTGKTERRKVAKPEGI